MARALDSASAVDRDAKIEQLLLTGLDHYFGAQYQQAINVWTRALFLDRSHARARAYIERARSAMAERQRESEEREAVVAAELPIRLDPTEPVVPVVRADPRPRAIHVGPGVRGGRWIGRLVMAAATIGIVAAGGYAAWSAVGFDPAPALTPPVVHETVLPVPRRGEMALTRARALAASGHLRDALAELDDVRPTDPQKVDADRLRAEVQRQLLAVTDRP